MTRRAKKHDKFLELYAATRTPRKQSVSLVSKMGVKEGWKRFLQAAVASVTKIA